MGAAFGENANQVEEAAKDSGMKAVFQPTVIQTVIVISIRLAIRCYFNLPL